VPILAEEAIERASLIENGKVLITALRPWAISKVRIA
jgi:hypothetical protein